MPHAATPPLPPTNTTPPPPPPTSPPELAVCTSIQACNAPGLGNGRANLMIAATAMIKGVKVGACAASSHVVLCEAASFHALHDVAARASTLPAKPLVGHCARAASGYLINCEVRRTRLRQPVGHHVLTFGTVEWGVAGGGGVAGGCGKVQVGCESHAPSELHEIWLEPESV